MAKEYIDVDWTECEDKPQYKNGVYTDPASALISGICGVANNITCAIREYNICKQQEETKRTEIKARLKLGLAEIKVKKEVILMNTN